jgi:hypothetical protein
VGSAVRGKLRCVATLCGAVTGYITLRCCVIMTDGIDLVAVARDFISKCDSRLTTFGQ